MVLFRKIQLNFKPLVHPRKSRAEHNVILARQDKNVPGSLMSKVAKVFRKVVPKSKSKAEVVDTTTPLDHATTDHSEAIDTNTGFTESVLFQPINPIPTDTASRKVSLASQSFLDKSFIYDSHDGSRNVSSGTDESLVAQLRHRLVTENQRLGTLATDADKAVALRHLETILAGSPQGQKWWKSYNHLFFTTLHSAAATCPDSDDNFDDTVIIHNTAESKGLISPAPSHTPAQQTIDLAILDDSDDSDFLSAPSAKSKEKGKSCLTFDEAVQRLEAELLSTIIRDRTSCEVVYEDIPLTTADTQEQHERESAKLHDNLAEQRHVQFVAERLIARPDFLQIFPGETQGSCSNTHGKLPKDLCGSVRRYAEEYACYNTSIKPDTDERHILQVSFESFQPSPCNTRTSSGLEHIAEGILEHVNDAESDPANNSSGWETSSDSQFAPEVLSPLPRSYARSETISNPSFANFTGTHFEGLASLEQSGLVDSTIVRIQQSDDDAYSPILPVLSYITCPSISNVSNNSLAFSGSTYPVIELDTVSNSGPPIFESSPPKKGCVKDDLLSLCLDQSTPRDSWLPIAEGLEGLNPASRFLPTIIHENSHLLERFLQAFGHCALDGSQDIYRSLQDTQTAFLHLKRTLDLYGLNTCVVEYLKPANHHNRVAEKLQQVMIDYSALEKKFITSQASLHKFTAAGSAEEIHGEERAHISAREHAELEVELASAKKNLEVMHRTQQLRLDKLERAGKPLESMVEILSTRSKIIDEQQSRMWARQEEYYDFFFENHDQPGAAAEVMQRMYSDLATEHVHVLSKYAQTAGCIYNLSSDNVQLKQQLKAEREIAENLRRIGTEMLEELEKTREKHEALIFDWELQTTGHKTEMDNLCKQVKSLQWRALLSAEQVQEAALHLTLMENDKLEEQLDAQISLTNDIWNELQLAKQCGIWQGIIADDAEELRMKRLPPTRCPKCGEEEEAVGFIDDSDIF